MLEDDEKRIEVAASKVVNLLVRKFGHQEAEARSLFDAFHARCPKAGGWAPADYYDHEGPEALAIEIEFQHQFPSLPRWGREFLEWRKKQWG